MANPPSSQDSIFPWKEPLLERKHDQRKGRILKAFRLKAVLTQSLRILAAAWLIQCVSGLFEPVIASHTHTWPDQIVPRLELRIDSQLRARGFCRGLKLIDSIGGDFEFFDRRLTGGRERIFYAAWKGRLREQAPGQHVLSGSDEASGLEYEVMFTQNEAGAIELKLVFKTPSRLSGVEFEVAKLSGGLFKGGGIVSFPKSLMDAKVVPLEPRSFKSRMLLSEKSRIHLQGALCDIEITDLMERRSLYAADGRSMPWDRHKSIVIGAKVETLEPESRQEFKYLIRALPSSRQFPEGGGVSSLRPRPLNARADFFDLKPKIEIKSPGFFRLTAEVAVYGSETGSAETVFLRGIERATSIRLTVREARPSQGERGIFFERIPKDGSLGLPREGFEITVAPERVIVRGADERGCLYGAYALLERLIKKNGGLEWACGKIRDWPDLPLRGACLELLRPAIRDVAIAKRYLEAYARARANLVVFLHNPKPVRAWMENQDDGSWTREQMAEIARHARWLHMDVWGGMGSAFHRQDFPEMEIREEANYFDPLVETNYEFLFRLYGTILTTYAPSGLLIGHDEIQGLSVYAERYGRSTADLIGYAVGRINDWLSAKGVRTAMWGDMLLDHEVWEARVGSANSRNPFFRSGATHLALPMLPKEVFILDWHYDARPRFESIRYFRENGFQVAGTSWHDPVVAKSLVESLRRFGGQGVISSDWGFLTTMSPAATTLHLHLCAWVGDCEIEEGASDVEAMANQVRDPVYDRKGLKSVVINLSRTANKSTVDDGSGNGVFGVGPAVDLRRLPVGAWFSGNVRFDIEPHHGGRNANCVVVENPGSLNHGVIADHVVFEGESRAQAVAFLNTCMLEEPQYEVRKLGHYLVEYENGHEETIGILENWNITDVRSSLGLRRNAWTFDRIPEVLIGSFPAWRGQSEFGVPLNLQLFIWENPHPDLKIRKIRLSAAGGPPRTKIVLVALTLLQ